MPHENDTLDDDLVMPIACCDHYDWEDSETSYNVRMFLAPTWKL